MERIGIQYIGFVPRTFLWLHSKCGEGRKVTVEVIGQQAAQ
jgi:hypothetical protein